MEKGTLLKKRYLIEETLGRGGFGVTYLARDLPERAVVCPQVPVSCSGQGYQER